MQRIMAWRLHANFISGRLDNRVPGKVTGWMRFYRTGQPNLKVHIELEGDFHEDIRGKVIRLRNPKPSEPENTEGTYMEGFARVQRGVTGDMTAGLSPGPWTESIAEKLMAQNEVIWDEAGVSQVDREEGRQKYAEHYRKHIIAGEAFHYHAPHPYLEWFSYNGRVVLELDPSQVEIVESVPVEEKSARELVAARRKRQEAMDAFMGAMVEELARQNREQGGDGNVFGVQAR
jgi:hypothetical protein